MEAKKKKRGKTKRVGLKSRYKSDAVSIQISVRWKKMPKGYKMTKALLEQLIRRKAATSAGYWDQARGRVIGAKEGRNPSGIELKIERWKNPDRNKGKDRTWRDYGSQADRWGSLRQAIENASIVLR